MPCVNHNHTGNKVNVSYPSCEVTQTITVPEYHLIRCLDDRKVSAVKFVRDQYGVSLRDAKNIVDTIHQQPNLSAVTS